MFHQAVREDTIKFIKSDCLMVLSKSCDAMRFNICMFSSKILGEIECSHSIPPIFIENEKRA